MALGIQEQILIEQRVANDGKSIAVAYLLLVFFGSLGAHRFYLGKTGTGLTMLALFFVGLLTVAIVIGLIPLVIVGIWCLIDLFLVPGLVQQSKAATREALYRQMSGAPSLFAQV